MRVKRELWRTTMAPTRSTVRLAVLARLAREKNSNAEKKERTQIREKNEDERKDEIKDREKVSEYMREKTW